MIEAVAVAILAVYGTVMFVLVTRHMRIQRESWNAFFARGAEIMKKQAALRDEMQELMDKINAEVAKEKPQDS